MLHLEAMTWCKRRGREAVLYAFDLIEHDGDESTKKFPYQL